MSIQSAKALIEKAMENGADMSEYLDDLDNMKFILLTMLSIGDESFDGGLEEIITPEEINTISEEQTSDFNIDELVKELFESKNFVKSVKNLVRGKKSVKKSVKKFLKKLVRGKK